VRLFVVVGVLLVTAGAFLLVDGGLRIQRCMATDVWSWRVWTSDFWLLIPSNPGLGLSQNAHWFLRAVGGLIAVPLGFKVIRLAAR